MVPVKATIELKEGMTVRLLFTPRLYIFKGVQGVTFQGELSELPQVYALYSDLLFAAALNHWTLDGEGHTIENAPFRRMDFHEFSSADPKAFGKAVNDALYALTGKGLKEHAAEAEKTKEKAKNEVKKKTTFGWITRLLRRS